jgi:hypothetical protein
MTDAERKELQKLLDTIQKLVGRRAGRFDLSVSTLPDGRYKVDLGSYGNASGFDFAQLTLYLSGLMQGLHINA